MYLSGEVRGWHLEQIERECRRRVDTLDAEWRRQFDDLARQVRETKSALHALELRASARITGTGDGLVDGMMMVVAWAPMALAILIMIAAARR